MIKELAKRYIVLLLLILLLSACSPAKTIKDIDTKLGETLFNDDNGENNIVKELASSSDGVITKNIKNGISPKTKAKIDNWLKENMLNRYGDKEGTFYDGGTPLFDEVTGSSTERFEYIFKKIPDILEQI